MSDSFIHELPLKHTPQKLRISNARFNAGGMIHNACLQEALRRLSLVKQSQDWQTAKKLPRSKERTELFRKALKQYSFSEYSLHTYVKTLVKKAFSDHIDSQVAQTLATRAFKSADEYAKGKRGRPRFKKIEKFSSLEGKSNVTGIRFKNGKIHWNGLILEPIYDKKDKYGVEAHALSSRIKYTRLIRRRVRGKVRLAAQLVLDGKPLIKKKNATAKEKKVGVDIGPSTIAFVGEKAAKLSILNPCSRKDSKKLQRALDRSKRAMNPDNYSEKGVPKKNVKWTFSKSYKKKREKLAEAMRVQGATRKTSHGRLANEIVSCGPIIQTEKLSYKAFQKCFGRSVAHHAPGLLIEMLRRKAENAGGQLIEFSPHKTKLSQTCHACTQVKKKPLKQRWHSCSCGLPPMQRDLYSAFLARHIEEDILNSHQASMAWSSAVPLLEQALLRVEETAKGKKRLACFGLNQRQSCSSVEVGSTDSEVKNDVSGFKETIESFEELRSSC